MAAYVRGTNLYKKIVNSDIPKQRKGRSLDFINKRNQCLIDRYLFYCLVTTNRYEAITGLLSNTFFLSQITIGELISDNTEMVLTLKKKYSSLSKAKLKNNLTIKWPELVWKISSFA